jgi:hypothetical protein
MALLGGDERKALGQVETQLVAKYGQRARAGAIGLFVSVIEHMSHEFEILAHDEEANARSVSVWVNGL